MRCTSETNKAENGTFYLAENCVEPIVLPDASGTDSDDDTGEEDATDGKTEVVMRGGNLRKSPKKKQVLLMYKP